MSKRTRLVLLVASGIVVGGLGTGLVAAYKGGGFQNLLPVGNDGPTEFAYVPRDVSMVGYADLHAVLTSQLWQKLHPAQSDTGRNEFQQKTGIDIQSDIDHVVTAATAQSAGQGMPLVLARGRFDVVKIEGVARGDGGSVETYKDIRMIVNAEKHFALAFLEPGLIGVGQPDTLKLAIDTKTGGEPVSKNDEVMHQVRDVDTSTAWAVARFDGSLPMPFMPVPSDVVKQLPAVNWVSVSGYVDDGLRGTVRAEARDEAAAKDLTDVIRGFMALARLQAGNQPQFAAVINSLQLSGHDKTVTLDFQIPPETLNSIAAMRSGPPRRVPQPSAPSRPAAPPV
jgi:hypothetical protein